MNNANGFALEKSWSSSGKCLGNKISQKKLSAAGEMNILLF